MNDTITIDGAGRIVIPKKVRDKLQLAAGDALALEFDGEQVVLRPAPPQGTMRKKRGIWVFHSGGPKKTEDDTRKLIEEAREERERRILGLDE